MRFALLVSRPFLASAAASLMNHSMVAKGSGFIPKQAIFVDYSA